MSEHSGETWALVQGGLCSSSALIFARALVILVFAPPLGEQLPKERCLAKHMRVTKSSFAARGADWRSQPCSRFQVQPCPGWSGELELLAGWTHTKTMSGTHGVAGKWLHEQRGVFVAPRPLTGFPGAWLERCAFCGRGKAALLCVACLDVR